MDSRTAIGSKHSRGVAMFVVLGVIVVLSLLGYIGLNLAKGDVDQSGSAVDLKSQRMTAIAGLNMAVAQLGRSDADLVALISDFQASVSTGSVKEWIVFGAPTLSLSSTDPGFTTSLGSDKSSCKVRILGVEGVGANASTLDITLESTGRGRNGDVHTAVATYRMTGLNSIQSTTSHGPSNAILSTGGMHSDGLNMNLNISGGIYSGGGTLTLQAASGSSVTRIRSEGNVKLNSDMMILENSVIKGDFSLNGRTADFKKNLVLNGTLNLDNTLTVEGSMIFNGCTGTSNADMVVYKDLLVNSCRFQTQGNVTVGLASTNNSRVWLNSGVGITTDSKLKQIYGSLFVKNAGATDDALYYANVTNTFRHDATSAGIDLVRVNIDGDAYFSQAVKSGGNFEGVTVGKRSVLMNGFSSNNGHDNTFTGDVFWKATAQSALNGHFKFGGSVSMNGTQASGWKGAWAFSGGSKKWSYTRDGSPHDCSSNLLYAATDIQLGTAVSCRDNDDLPPDWVSAAPTVIKEKDDLGYTDEDLNVSPTTLSNEASKVNTGNFPANFLTTAQWSNVISRNSTCHLNHDAPSAADIACIYTHERAAYDGDKVGYKGPLYAGTDGNHTFLVINITSDWMNMKSPPQVIPKGVHVMFIINTALNVHGQWFTNEEGSTQVVYVNADPGAFGWNGTVYGFVQFNVSGKVQLSSAGNMKIFGAIESANLTGQIQGNNGSLTVDINSSSATVVRDKIVMAFTSAADPNAGPTNDIIRFNGDRNVQIKSSQKLGPNDGWVQFQRLGEFR